MESIIIYIAGLAEGNPGPAGVGIYITNTDGTLVGDAKKAIGNSNENFANYYAVTEAMDTLKQIYGEQTKEMHFEFRLENELVKKQLNGEQPINEPGLVPMFIQIHNSRVISFPKIIFTLVTKSNNLDANRLAEEVMSPQ